MSDLPPIIGYAIDPSHEAPAEYDVQCTQCGASIISLAGDRCLKCGQGFDPSTLPLARVPWLYRQRYGSLNAYARTVWRVLTGPVGFASELSRPVRMNVADARRFRKISIWIAVISVMIPIILAAGLYAHAMRYPAYIRVFALAITVLWAIPMLRVLFGVMTDLPTFIWKGAPDRPDELQPVHLYASAPLAIMPLLSSAIVVGIVIGVWFPKWDQLLLVQNILIGVIAIFIGVACYATCINFARGVQMPAKRLATLAMYLPLHAGMALFLSLAGWVVPALYLGVIR